MNNELRLFLRELQGHPLWAELMNSVPAPTLPRFQSGDEKNPQNAQAKWIYRSGELLAHERWRNHLLGDVD